MKRLDSFAASSLLAAALCFAIIGCSTTGDARHHSGHVHLASDDLPLTAYPFAKCLVCDKPLPNKPRAFVRSGQEVKLCSTKCLADFNKSPDNFMAKIP